MTNASRSPQLAAPILKIVLVLDRAEKASRRGRPHYDEFRSLSAIRAAEA